MCTNSKAEKLWYSPGCVKGNLQSTMTPNWKEDLSRTYSWYWQWKVTPSSSWLWRPAPFVVLVFLWHLSEPIQFIIPALFCPLSEIGWTDINECLWIQWESNTGDCPDNFGRRSSLMYTSNSGLNDGADTATL